MRVKADAPRFVARAEAEGCTVDVRDDSLIVRMPEGRSERFLWEVAAWEQLANPPFAAAAKHARGGLSQGCGAPLMPIFDQGYQHWNGPLSGHAWRSVAIARHGVRIGMQRRVFRSMLLIALLPAVALAAVLAMWAIVERKLTIAEPILDFLRSNGLLDQEVLARPQRIPGRGLDSCVTACSCRANSCSRWCWSCSSGPI